MPSLRGRSFVVVGVDGWGFGEDNPCLSAEVAWARKASDGYQLYLFLNSPASPTDRDQSGPAGNCKRLRNLAAANCLAYNYGYNAAAHALTYARSVGARATTWWLDIENYNGTCASGEWSEKSQYDWWSCDTGLNRLTIAAAINSLHHGHVTAGVYSMSGEWKRITNDLSIRDVPIWVAGAKWTSGPYPGGYHYPPASSNAPMCAGSRSFGGGRATLLQETPGDNHFPYDPEYAC